MREEIPHLGLGPGDVTATIICGGPIHGHRGVTAAIERTPADRIPVLAPVIGGTYVRQAAPTRFGRALGSASIVADECVAQRAPTSDITGRIPYAVNANVCNWFGAVAASAERCARVNRCPFEYRCPVTCDCVCHPASVAEPHGEESRPTKITPSDLRGWKVPSWTASCLSRPSDTFHGPELVRNSL